MRRRAFIGLFGAAVAWPHAARGQQPASRIIGVLGYGSVEDARTGVVPTQRRLAEMGYVEGRNLTIEYRGANGRQEQLAELAAELVQRRVDAIVAFSGPAIVAAKAATTSVPILLFTGFDPVQSGFVAASTGLAAMPPGFQFSTLNCWSTGAMRTNAVGKVPSRSSTTRSALCVTPSCWNRRPKLSL